jgi:hypothetical protein
MQNAGAPGWRGGPTLASGHSRQERHRTLRARALADFILDGQGSDTLQTAPGTVKCGPGHDHVWEAAARTPSPPTVKRSVSISPANRAAEVPLTSPRQRLAIVWMVTLQNFDKHPFQWSLRVRCVSREAQPAGPLPNKMKDDGLTETVSVDLPAVASRPGDSNLGRQ